MEYSVSDSRIIIYDNNMQVGYVSYVIRNDVLIIEHTIVPPEYRGNSYASLLIKKVVEFSKDNNYRIKPICSYAVAWFKRNKEYIDILI